MSLNELTGNRAVIGRLTEAIKNGSIFHAYIFEGKESDDRMLIAANFAKAILCGAATGDSCDACISCIKADHGNHEDIIHITADGASIKDEVVEWMQNRLKKKPFTGSRNIAIIDKADTMTLRAQNRLLKTLEEPAGGTVIILLAENAGNLTSTILSRCIINRITTSSNYGMTTEYDEKYGLVAIGQAIVSGRPLYELAPRLTELSKNREESLEMMDIMECWFRDMLLICCGSTAGIVNKDYEKQLTNEAKLHRPSDLATIIRGIEKAKKDINLNINAGYALKSMLLWIQEEKDDKSCWR